MVIWTAEITCKLGSLSWVTLRNFKIANLLWTKQKDRISLTPAELMLLIFLHGMWVLELCSSCNGAISQLLLAAVVCIPVNTLQCYEVGICPSHLPMNLPLREETWQWLSASHFFTIQFSSTPCKYWRGPCISQQPWQVCLRLCATASPQSSTEIMVSISLKPLHPSQITHKQSFRSKWWFQWVSWPDFTLYLMSSLYLMEKTSDIVWNLPHQSLCTSVPSWWAGTKVMGQLHTVLILGCLKGNKFTSLKRR